MDLVHHIYRLMLGGKLHKAPIADDIHRVLDMGTGTGIWAMDFAEYVSLETVDICPNTFQRTPSRRGSGHRPESHPAQVVSKEQGTGAQEHRSRNTAFTNGGRTPPNCVFEVDDYESEWTYRRPFDFIIGRELEGCIGDDAGLFRRAYEHLRPGGYLEMQGVYPEFVSDDDTAKGADNAHKWMRLMCEGSNSFGKSLEAAGSWKEKMIAAGFTDVQQELLKASKPRYHADMHPLTPQQLPIGGWPKDPKLKEIGKCQVYQELQVLDAYTPGLFSRVLGWSKTEIEVFLAKVRTDIKNPAIHIYLPVYFVWGRKL